MSEDLAGEHRDAAALAVQAGRALMELREAPPAGTRDLGAAGDHMSHHLLVSELNRLYPADLVRSEEGLEHVANDGRLWIVDPLDGTREFRERGRIDWAVHVALSIGGAPVVGAVALPALDMVLSTGAPPELKPPTGEQPRLVVSRSRPPEVAYDVAEALGAVMVPLGSAGAKIAAVILGDAEVYVHAGGQYEWDSCAPAAVALASGLHASRLDGEPLRYGDPDAWLPDLVVCRPEYASAVLDVTTRQRRPYW
ncbi:MAG TPA: 3'(2'),5'-bisphosphate nucleotidase CysQ [Acidimicrobiales bacterium]|jgi:3'(2'), 5'-bisphosphate nucleotidase|nr:3'(2'),5'-bisphosphate nucleotidase CysQ [Acidimicrobiales bacterium]